MKQTIIETAGRMVDEHGLINLSQRDLCERVQIPVGSFTHIMECTFTQFILKLYKEQGNGELRPVKKSRVAKALRHEQLLQVALIIAVEIGYNNLTRDAIAERADVSVSLVTSHFGTMKQLKRKIMREAIKQEIPEIIAQGLVIKDAHAMKAPQGLKTLAAVVIASY